MNAVLCWALAFSFSLAAQPAGDCRRCHGAIVDTYLRTGMGRSLTERLSPSDATFYHRLSNRHYRVSGGRMRRHQVDAQGREVNVVEKTIDLAIGSGNHAVTYVHRSPEERLLELPVTFYALDGWAMSPGYDKADHLDFRREITESCLFCHSASARPAPIDCGRCHGDSKAHLARPGRGTILNPSKLPAARQLEICLQCHLETTSGAFPDSQRKPGREVFSFQAGQQLDDYKVYFDRADGAERLEINHAGYRLLESKCFQGSQGRLTCTTCHDPHSAEARNACASCHNSGHVGAGGDCVSCHMPKRRTQDAIHVRMTDHKIARRPVIVDAEREPRTGYEGPLRVFFGGGSTDWAQTRQVIDSGRGTEADYRRWLSLEPESAQAMAGLGEALMRFGKREEALPFLRRALARHSGNVVALNALAVHEATAGRLEPAWRLLEQARRARPEHPLTWINLGVTYEAQGARDRAEAAYREAIRHQPDSSEARRRLAALLAR